MDDCKKMIIIGSFGASVCAGCVGRFVVDIIRYIDSVPFPLLYIRVLSSPM